MTSWWSTSPPAAVTGRSAANDVCRHTHVPGAPAGKGHQPSGDDEGMTGWELIAGDALSVQQAGQSSGESCSSPQHAPAASHGPVPSATTLPVSPASSSSSIHAASPVATGGYHAHEPRKRVYPAIPVSSSSSSESRVPPHGPHGRTGVAAVCRSAGLVYPSMDAVGTPHHTQCALCDMVHSLDLATLWTGRQGSRACDLEERVHRAPVSGPSPAHVPPFSDDPTAAVLTSLRQAAVDQRQGTNEQGARAWLRTVKGRLSSAGTSTIDAIRTAGSVLARTASEGTSKMQELTARANVRTQPSRQAVLQWWSVHGTSVLVAFTAGFVTVIATRQAYRVYTRRLASHTDVALAVQALAGVAALQAETAGAGGTATVATTVTALPSEVGPHAGSIGVPSLPALGEQLKQWVWHRQGVSSGNGAADGRDGADVLNAAVCAAQQLLPVPAAASVAPVLVPVPSGSPAPAFAGDDVVAACMLEGAPSPMGPDSEGFLVRSASGVSEALRGAVHGVQNVCRAVGHSTNQAAQHAVKALDRALEGMFMLKAGENAPAVTDINPATGTTALPSFPVPTSAPVSAVSAGAQAVADGAMLGSGNIVQAVVGSAPEGSRPPADDVWGKLPSASASSFPWGQGWWRSGSGTDATVVTASSSSSNTTSGREAVACISASQTGTAASAICTCAPRLCRTAAPAHLYQH